MPRIIISRRVHDLVQSKAILPFKSNGIPTIDGNVSVEIAEETLVRIHERSLPGESVSDTLERVLSGKLN